MMIIVGFQKQVTYRGLLWLKRGYRHCFAYRQLDEGWILCDPLANHLLLQEAPALRPRDLMVSLAALGTSVVHGNYRPSGTPGSWLRPLTCVEVCKRLIACHNRWILTPRQLFCHLVTDQRKLLDAILA
jgi:hypothetical protein